MTSAPSNPAEGRAQPEPRNPSAVLGEQTRRIGTYQQFKFLRWVVMSVLVMNLVDGLLTLVWIWTGLAHEANPLLADLVDNQPVLFMAAKTSLVGLGSWLLWHHRKRKAAVVAIFVCFLAYYYILLYHLSAMNLGLVDRLLTW